MKKNVCLTGMAFLLSTLAFNVQGKTGIVFKGADEIETLKNSTLCVVVLEENQKYEDKLTKAHRPQLVKAYQDNIKLVNDNIKAMAEKYLTMTKGFEYKTMSEIIEMPQATREGYSFLAWDRSSQFATGAPTPFAFDFFATNPEELKGMRDDYMDLMQFDCADPKYHGEDDYRKADIIVKGRKKISETIFEESFDMVIPTQGSAALCFMGLQKQFEAAQADDKKLTKDDVRQAELKQVATARTKMLLICKDNLDRNITEVKIGAVFKYKFKVITRQEFDNAILNKDANSCLLVVYPVDKTQGGFKPIVNYEHRIVDAETDDILLSVTPPVSATGMPVSYAKVNDKQFKDIVKAEDDITK